MAHPSALVVLGALAALCGLVFCSSSAFLPVLRATPPVQLLHGEMAAAAAAAAVASPSAANAFYYDGKEYFDITYGISPLAWGIAAFAIITYGSILKNAALKYNQKYPDTPYKSGKFVSQRIINKEAPYKVKG